MAKPRVFISSTFYDQRHIRADLAIFIGEMGYEAVLSERGNVPYGAAAKPEDYCYKEIQNIDILVAIVGGRYGSPSSKNPPHSISQVELKTAYDLGKPIYIFVDRNVMGQYKLYQDNKDQEGITYTSVDDIRVFKFIEEIEAFPRNNPMAPFETSGEIKSYLKDQWAGLLQRLLQEQSRVKEVRILEDMKETARTLNQMVTFLTEAREKGDEAIKDILLSNHPAFEQVRKKLLIKYRVFFTNREELNALLSAKGFDQLRSTAWDDPNYEEWYASNRKKRNLFKIATNVFDEDDKLKIFTAAEWDKDNIKVETYESEAPDDVDDVPF